jgi:hypothetical protein
MNIIIHSKSRAGLARGTCNSLRGVAWDLGIVLAVPWDQAQDYREAHPEFTVEGLKPCDYLPQFQHQCMGIPGDDRVVLLDDDLVFAARTPDLKSLPGATDDDLRAMFRWIGGALLNYGHATIDTRNGNNLNIVKGKTREGGPARSVLGINRKAYRKLDVRFGDVDSKGDYHVTLSLLERGLPNIISHMWTHDFSSKQLVAGGCTDYRTLALHAAASHDLAKLHPRHVTVVDKGGRTDVRVQWRKALAYGKMLYG